MEILLPTGHLPRPIPHAVQNKHMTHKELCGEAQRWAREQAQDLQKKKEIKKKEAVEERNAARLAAELQKILDAHEYLSRMASKLTGERPSEAYRLQAKPCEVNTDHVASKLTGERPSEAYRLQAKPCEVNTDHVRTWVLKPANPSSYGNDTRADEDGLLLSCC
jgi:hypothetical protein